MNWFRAWFDPAYVPRGDAEALVRMAKTAKQADRRREAICALVEVQMTDEVFKLLNDTLRDPEMANAAIFALAKNNDARGKSVVLNIARSEGPLAQKAAEEIHFDRRTPAELLKVALTDENYYRVEKAVNGLVAWDTPEAKAALKTFQQGKSRNLDYERVDPVDGLGNYEGEPFWIGKPSSDLGQQP